jgi:small subunit ribosomal protein S17
MAKQMIGIVSSDKADKTITVTVSAHKTHPIYRKQYSVSTKFLAHDEKNEATTGDKVAIVETRPRSARKRYELTRIIEKPVLRAEDLKVEAEAAVQEVTEKPKKAEVEKKEETK